ncbi:MULTISPECIES: hypothetical protein [Pseudoalteromonas]|uniref:Phospholipase A1 n=1 Tax=Pseudoalteromonas amylolytica TaxID=1859457 RepID=A0A1S1N3H0_9GAMM|nr:MULTISPECIES: hypothetical protein [Pseudoalteromonas]OHU91840.1 hypothetical protein BFC16_02445 [Pseudoalteromonas sp. JW3]OHU93166.1 hypothetical protein BET10_02355 [Pseudoalteromonas amylolytica]
MRCYFLYPLFCLLLLCNVSNAAPQLSGSLPEKQQEKRSEKGTQSPAQESFFKNIQPYEGTEIYVDYFRGNDLDGALDVQYSFKYVFGRDMNFKKEGDFDWNAAFSFSGEFDFYLGTRNSGPVVGRRYNPGFQLAWGTAKRDNFIEWRFSLEHESNGQTSDSLPTLLSLARDNKAQYAQKYPDIDNNYYLHMATETVSRSSDFVAVGGVYRVNPYDVDYNDCHSIFSCFDIHLKFRKIWGDAEDMVFWDASKRHDRLEDYQGTDITFVSQFLLEDRILTLLGGQSTLSLRYRSGEIWGGDVGTNNTFDVSFTSHLHITHEIQLPIIFSYHAGYLEELYKYSEKAHYLRVGFALNF